MYTNLQNNLPQDESQAEVSFDNVSQNVFNLTGRHGITLQSNSKSAQDGSRFNISGGIYHESCVVSHFASMTKRSVPVPVVASLSVRVHIIVQTTFIRTCTMFSLQIGIIFQIITLLTLYTFITLHTKIIFLGWLGIHCLKR